MMFSLSAIQKIKHPSRMQQRVNVTRCTVFKAGEGYWLEGKHGCVRVMLAGKTMVATKIGSRSTK